MFYLFLYEKLFFSCCLEDDEEENMEIREFKSEFKSEKCKNHDKNCLECKLKVKLCNFIKICIIEVCLLKYYFESHLILNDAIIDKQA